MPRIDPADFTETQWIEAFYATEFLPTEHHAAAEPFEASVEAIKDAALCCRSKAERVRDGELGESDEGEGVDIEDWGDDLDEAAAVLEAYLEA